MPTRSASDRGQTAIVTAHLWRLSRRDIPWALRAVARDRRRIRALPGARFVKLLGTSHGFTPFDADLRRWLLISAWREREAAALPPQTGAGVGATPEIAAPAVAVEAA